MVFKIWEAYGRKNARFGPVGLSWLLAPAGTQVDMVATSYILSRARDIECVCVPERFVIRSYRDRDTLTLDARNNNVASEKVGTRVLFWRDRLAAGHCCSPTP